MLFELDPYCGFRRLLSESLQQPVVNSGLRERANRSKREPLKGSVIASDSISANGAATKCLQIIMNIPKLRRTVRF